MSAIATAVPVASPSMEDPQQQQTRVLREHEAKVFSQFNEDGILRFLFDRIGATQRTFVEFGIGNGKECNTANLSVNHGWSGLLMEGNETDVSRARGFYASLPQVRPGQVNVVPAFITAENINELLSAHGPTGSIDLLSLDIDGNDLWVWQAITAIRPRVVVIEYNAAFGPERSVSVRYDPAFERFRYHASGIYHGASLAAMAKVGHEKGYVLVGCESHGVNAFFVLEDLARNAQLTAIAPRQAYFEHAWRAARFGSSEQQFEIIRHLDLIPV
jgi:hypothetical protein